MIPIGRYIVRRAFISLIVLLLVSVMLYSLVRSMPADYVTVTTANSDRMTEEMRIKLRKIYGLDKSIPEGYISWLKSAVTLDMGDSLIYRRPVIEVIKEFAPVTFTIALLALFGEMAVAIPLGILAARKQYSKADYMITSLVFIGISLPTFFFAALLKRAFGFYGLDILPTAGMLTARVTYTGFTFAKFLDYAAHLILPILTFIITGAGSWLRYVRTTMLDSLNSDYVRTARAKGVSEHRVVYSHAFRNTLIPIVTMLGASLPSLFSGAAITEGIFSLGGLGSVGMAASTLGDVPYLMGFNMFLALCTILGYLISDILYAVVDPRIRLS